MATKSNQRSSILAYTCMMATLLALSAISLSEAKLSVLSPMNLQAKFISKCFSRDTFIDGTIRASYSNFGYIPYGHSIVSTNRHNQVCRLADCTMTATT
jgi:hypothetical protein